jgi:glyoxylase-like metal-dependent hydrolase (beta-lactamase superfamily II)
MSIMSDYAARMETTMRTLIALIVWSGVILTPIARADDAFGPVEAAPAAESFRIGTLRVTALRDAQFVAPNDAKVFGVDAGTEAVATVLKAAGLPGDRISLSVNALIVRSGARIVLFDSGLGAKGHGNLVASLKVAGLTPDQVTDVVITHSHGDHVGGLVDAGGKATFPRATIRLSTAEWAYMKSQPQAEDLVHAVQAHVRTFNPGAVIAPGITAIALDGHTPGHVGYEIASGGRKMLDIGDLAHSSLLSLQRPEWTMGFDGDAVLAKVTRRKTLARLAQDQEWVFAPHFPFPGVGHVAADGDAFKWVPGTP